MLGREQRYIQEQLKLLTLAFFSCRADHTAVVSTAVHYGWEYILPLRCMITAHVAAVNRSNRSAAL